MAAVDDFGGRRDLNGPAIRAELVTPNETTDLAYVTLFIRVTGAGNINAILAGATAPVVLPFLAGETQRIRVRRILVTNTTATGIIGYS